MSEPFGPHEMQRSMLRAGVTPRDLAGLMPCHAATLYSYLRTGTARPLTLFSFERLYEFMEVACKEGILPFNESPKLRGAYVKRAYDHWHFTKKTFDGFSKGE